MLIIRDFVVVPAQVKRDMVAIKHELDTVQQVKEEIEELREYVDRLEEHTHRRKLRLLEQVGGIELLVWSLFFGYVLIVLMILNTHKLYVFVCIYYCFILVIYILIHLHNHRTH